MKSSNYKKVISIILFFIVLSIQLGFAGDLLPDQPGDPYGMSVPIDGGILMALLAGGSLVTMFFKKKKQE